MSDLQQKYEDLKKNYEMQMASLRGTSVERAISKKKLKATLSTDVDVETEKEREREKEKKRLEAAAAVVHEGAMQYRVLGIDGKKAKVMKDFMESWAVLNNQFLEFYPNKEARFTKKKVKVDLTGASVEYDRDTKKKKEANNPIRLNTETHGSYQLSLATLEDTEEWYKAIQQICTSNANTNMDEIAAGLARRSHCIPHRFKETFFTITQAKCKVCNSAIHGRGYRCIRETPFLSLSLSL